MIDQHSRLGEHASLVKTAMDEFQAQNALQKLWARDPSFWTDDPKAAEIIANSLGWLTVAEMVRGQADDLSAWADEIHTAGFRHVVLLGMGGSSLCPEVLRRTHIPYAGHPELIVLDSTVPAAVARVREAIKPEHTLFLVSSKSGTTTEPECFRAYFFEEVRRAGVEKPGANFVAITDPGTALEEKAKSDGYRRIFTNPPDIGGRYSALSYFGMVPAALMGLDIRVLLDRALDVARLCRPEAPVDLNPGLRLGAALGALATSGRNKLTLVIPPPMEALGLWIEQLIAESTGKQGRGIVPVAGEPLGSPEVYGSDRLFVRIRLSTRDAAARSDPQLDALAHAGHPVLDLTLDDPMDLGAEFFRWEVATALAGQRLGINPFDQPNVKESKDNTKALLAEFQEHGSLREPEILASFGHLSLSTDAGNRDALRAAGASGTDRDGCVALLKAHLQRTQPGDYVAITQYIDENDPRDETLQKLRTRIRDARKVATTTGYGPRFLHSTGQLHKGGPPTGVFLQITASEGAGQAIPGHPFDFATLVKAQALGDFQSLAGRGLRALRVHLGQDVDRGLKLLDEMLAEALAS